MPDQLWTVRDLAEYVGVHTKTVYRWMREGDAPSGIRFGRYLRYRPDDVVAWLEAHRQEPQGTP